VATSDNDRALNLLRGLTEPGAPEGANWNRSFSIFDARRYWSRAISPVLKDYLMSEGHG